MDDERREPLQVLVFSASLRTDSLNARLATSQPADRGTGCVGRSGVDARVRRPVLRRRRGDRAGLPAGAQEFRARLEAADAFVIVSPEYNGSMPGVLKNAIDWVSRARPQPFNQHSGLLMSASPSMAGGNRGLWALRVPLEHMGARIYPDMFSLAQAHTAFTDDGSLADERLQGRFDDTIAGFLDLVEASKHYPCIKRAWVEFLGEHPDPAIDRVDT